MYRYFEPKDDSFFAKWKTFQWIIEQLNPFISNLKSGEDKQLMFKTLSNYYHKYHESIKTKAKDDTELMLSIIMVLLMEQRSEIERLDLLTKMRRN